ncbi:MAG TPA: NUDIX hydrolase [Candidatus Limnocylindria bacterium]|nr:NUDIX hydrolase [Candidatus Limnocylindria bacterium]
MTDFAHEIAELATRYGDPRRVDAPIRDGFFDPIHNPDRLGEVCMVVRRPNGKLLLSIKTFYPRGAHRLPTGGIHHGERIFEALVRETKEETGLETEPRRFLAAISYRAASSPDGPPIFHTFAFLLIEIGGELGALDRTERIEEWIEIDTSDLPAVADRLERVTSEHSHDIGGDWADWGRFRAVVHRVVHEELAR